MIWGNNGSGKTSVLEAIHTLSLGKSFRTHRQRSMIRAGENSFVLKGSFLTGNKKNIIASGMNILDIVLQTKLGNSKSEIRRMIKNNGLKINNEVVTDEAKIIYQNDFGHDNNIKISHGKKQHVIIKII